MIEEARRQVAATVNAGLTMLYWRIGDRIGQEVLRGGRADYGKEILATLSQELVRVHGRGFSYTALTRMVRFEEVVPDDQTVSALRRQLSCRCAGDLVPAGAVPGDSSRRLPPFAGLIRQLRKTEGTLLSLFPGQKTKVRSFYRSSTRSKGKTRPIRPLSPPAIA